MKQMIGMLYSTTDLMAGKRKFPKRGEIYWVNLNPVVGCEIQKIRPALIISNDIGNEVSDIIVVAPITSKIKNIFPFEVQIKLSGKHAKVMLNQCRAIDKKRLGKYMEEIDKGVLQEVEEAIKIVFSLS